MGRLGSNAAESADLCGDVRAALGLSCCAVSLAPFASFAWLSLERSHTATRTTACSCSSPPLARHAADQLLSQRACVVVPSSPSGSLSTRLTLLPQLRAAFAAVSLHLGSGLQEKNKLLTLRPCSELEPVDAPASAHPRVAARPARHHGRCGRRPLEHVEMCVPISLPWRRRSVARPRTDPRLLSPRSAAGGSRRRQHPELPRRGPREPPRGRRD